MGFKSVGPGILGVLGGLEEVSLLPTAVCSESLAKVEWHLAWRLMGVSSYLYLGLQPHL